MGYVFLIPGFVFLGCFLVFPFFKSLVRSFTDWNAFSPDFSFVGLKNYIELFHNDEYWAAIKVNLVFAVVSTLIQTTLGFLLAFAVYYMTPKWQQFYKVALYIPVVLPASVVAVMWKFMLNKDIGLVNTLLRLVGLDNLTHAWIGEKSTALGTVIAVNTWQYIGFTMVLFYIAMMNISKDVLESAAVDGATKKICSSIFPSAYCGNDGNKRHPFYFRRYEILCPVLYADRRWPRQGDDCSCTADLYYGVR